GWRRRRRAARACFYWSGVRVTGLSRGWPDLGTARLRWSGVRVPGLSRGWPDLGTARLRWSGVRVPGLSRGWPDLGTARLRARLRGGDPEDSLDHGGVGADGVGRRVGEHPALMQGHDSV